MLHSKKIFLAGHNGMVGSSLRATIEKISQIKLVVANRDDLDLTNQAQVNKFFKNNSFDMVILAAAKVGGIWANSSYPAEFIYENLMIEDNIIHASHSNNIQKLLFLGSSCIYPRESPQPIHESSLLAGALEPTNEPYAIAKIAGIKLCESYNRQFKRDYRSIMPTNLYGPGDNFDAENSHVIPALIQRFTAAAQTHDSEVVIWGSGKPTRDFLHVDDLTNAAIEIMSIEREDYSHVVTPMQSHINIGSGKEYSIEELARLIAKLCMYKGKIVFDSNKPDGTMKKLLDNSIIESLGWKPQITLEDGLNKVIKWYRSNHT
jgi:GDP-L-fucose synthase